MKWVVVAALACAALGLGVAKRDWLIRRFQHAPGTRLELGFDRPVPHDALERVRELLASRMPVPESVRIVDDRVVVELDPDPETRSRVRELEQLVASPPHVALRVEDTGSGYMKLVSRRGSIDRLGLVAKVDARLETFLTRGDDYSRSVTQAWADKHACHGERIEYLGVQCKVTGRQLLDAFFQGDDDLGVAELAPELAVPLDREVVYGRQDDGVWRTFLVERDALVLDASAIANIDRAGSGIRVGLTPTGAVAIARQAEHSTTGILAIVIDGEVHGEAGAQAIRASDQLVLDPKDYDALTLASLPAPLRILDESSY